MELVGPSVAGHTFSLEQVVAKALSALPAKALDQYGVRMSKSSLVSSIYIPWEPPSKRMISAVDKGIAATGQVVSSSDGAAAKEGGMWGRLKKKVAIIQENSEAADTSSKSKMHIGFNDVLKVAAAKQESELQDEREASLQEIARPKTVDESERANMHASFKSRRRTSIAVTPAMLQAIEKRTRETEALLAQATAVQAKAIAEGRVSKGVAEKKSQTRSRRSSCGEDALEAAMSLTQIWAKSGTADDLFRPENNQAGFIAPTAKEMVVELLGRRDAAEAEEKLKRLFEPRREFTPTRPITPRLGVVRALAEPLGRAPGQELALGPEAMDRRAARAAGRDTTANGWLAAALWAGPPPPLSERPLCYSKLGTKLFQPADLQPLCARPQSAVNASAPLPDRAAEPFQQLPKAQEATARHAARMRTTFEKTQAWLGLRP